MSQHLEAATAFRGTSKLPKLSCLISCSKLCSAKFKILQKQKLVAHCYDGASVMSEQYRDVHSIVKEAYPNAYHVHCYAYQLNLILQQAVSSISSVRVFFANLSALSL